MMRWRARATFLCLLLLFFGQLAFGARYLSLTADEPAHIVRGYVYLTTNDFWMIPVLGHPPLIEGWAALPLLLNPDRPAPLEVAYWKENAALYIQSLLPLLGTVAQLEVLSRVPVMLLATLLVALIFRWASELAGDWGGVWAAILMVWNPTMIAHAQLDTTDLGVTLLTFASMYMFWKTARGPTPGRLVATGILTGLAMAAKHSGMVALFLIGLLIVWEWYRAIRGEKKLLVSRTCVRRYLVSQTLRWGARGGAILLIGTLVLWAVYRFEIERLAGPPWIIPFPSHIRSVYALFESKARLAFLRGQLREGGWWYYYPYVFFIKTPLPFIAAMFFSIYDELRRGKPAWIRDISLWLFPLLYWGVVMRGGMYIGYRHLLPTFPFIYVLVGQAVARASCLRSRPGRWVTAALLAWYILGTWRAYPHTIAYFNELVGGPTNGYRHVVDSNLDWGHSFKALAQYMREEGLDEVRLSYWTWVDPALYGVKYTPLPPAPSSEEEEHFPSFAPPPGVYAISATTLQGILLHNTDLYGWFRHQTPVAQPGYGVLVYRVEPVTPASAWVGQCTTPVSPLPPSEIERGFGGQVRRIAYFDCVQAWLYPDGGRTSGWFVLHHEALGRADEWTSSRLTGMRLSYTQKHPGRLPPFFIYEWTPSPFPQFEASVLVPTDPEMPVGGSSLPTPISFDGPLILRGFQVVSAGELTFELQTWWEVNDPPSRPFSLMAHMVNAKGQAVGVADGLGVPFTEMRQGDLLFQRHTFLLTEEAAAGADVLWFQTGGYWLDTMERWPVMAESKAVGDRVVLTSVKLPGQ